MTGLKKWVFLSYAGRAIPLSAELLEMVYEEHQLWMIQRP